SLFNEDIDFYQMDAHELEFEDETFDLIITRNVTWNLERPIEAYEDWYRVLKPNGKLMNFDANWYGYIHDEEKKEEFEQNRLHSLKVNGDDNFDNIDCQKVDTNVMENIAHRLPLSKIERPKWDQYVLDDIGYDSIKVDCGIGNRIWHEGEQIKYKSTPMFMICARK
ncbi:MAG TPA: SAM-dependent methyltransferase, partial [Eubacteriaceae bacterium]|nr:SAM-dependent methyltransferase [Eubacteriaceae bacterium]